MPSKVKVTLRMNQAAVDSLARDVSRTTTKRAADRTVQRTKDNITRSGRVRTGKMRSSVRATPMPNGEGYYVGSDLRYFRFQEDGTRGSVARPGGVLAFRNKSGVLVFAKRVRGIKPGHFLRDALRALTSRDFTGT